MAESSFSRLMDVDPDTGTETWFHYDAVTEECTVETKRDLQHVIDDNKVIFNEFDERARWRGDGGQNRVASIPDFIWYDLVKRGITRDKKAFRKWLNDPDNRAWRTRPGRV